MFRRQQKMLQKLISMTKNLIIEQRRQNLLAESIPTYRQRTFSTPLVPHLSADRPRYNAAVQSQITGKASVEIPADVTMENLHECLNDLDEFLDIQNRTTRETSSNASEESSQDESFLQEGVKVHKALLIVRISAKGEFSEMNGISIKLHKLSIPVGPLWLTAATLR